MNLNEYQQKKALKHKLEEIWNEHGCRQISHITRWILNNDLSICSRKGKAVSLKGLKSHKYWSPEKRNYVLFNQFSRKRRGDYS